jgi:hypothetical protein
MFFWWLAVGWAGAGWLWLRQSGWGGPAEFPAFFPLCLDRHRHPLLRTESRVPFTKYGTLPSTPYGGTIVLHPEKPTPYLSWPFSWPPSRISSPYSMLEVPYEYSDWHLVRHHSLSNLLLLLLLLCFCFCNCFCSLCHSLFLVEHHSRLQSPDLDRALLLFTTAQSVFRSKN